MSSYVCSSELRANTVWHKLCTLALSCADIERSTASVSYDVSTWLTAVGYTDIK